MCRAELSGVGRGAALTGQLETETIGKLLIWDEVQSFDYRSLQDLVLHNFLVFCKLSVITSTAQLITVINFRVIRARVLGQKVWSCMHFKCYGIFCLIGLS